MVRLSDVVPAQRHNLENLECPTISGTPIQPPRALDECNVALISSAGLMQRSEANVPGNSSDYRIINADTAATDVLMNHVSVNFDRTGFAEDLNCVLPVDRLAELEASGKIKAASTRHYSFMGATAPELMRDNVDKLTDELVERGINTVCLLPV